MQHWENDKYQCKIGRLGINNPQTHSDLGKQILFVHDTTQNKTINIQNFH